MGWDGVLLIFGPMHMDEAVAHMYPCAMIERPRQEDWRVAHDVGSG